MRLALSLGLVIADRRGVRSDGWEEEDNRSDYSVKKLARTNVREWIPSNSASVHSFFKVGCRHLAQCKLYTHTRSLNKVLSMVFVYQLGSR
jgi:hypothetical protein